jgi:hypothetical protein
VKANALFTSGGIIFGPLLNPPLDLAILFSLMLGLALSRFLIISKLVALLMVHTMFLPYFILHTIALMSRLWWMF